jgi:hypothetical protein
MDMTCMLYDKTQTGIVRKCFPTVVGLTEWIVKIPERRAARKELKRLCFEKHAVEQAELWAKKGAEITNDGHDWFKYHGFYFAEGAYRDAANCYSNAYTWLKKTAQRSDEKASFYLSGKKSCEELAERCKRLSDANDLLRKDKNNRNKKHDDNDPSGGSSSYYDPTAAIVACTSGSAGACG